MQIRLHMSLLNFDSTRIAAQQTCAFFRAKVYRCNFWMCFYNSKTPKRTSLWSNSKYIQRFWLGKLTKKGREYLKRKHGDFKTVIKYTDKSGRKRFHGSKQLRSTQNLVSQYRNDPINDRNFINMYLLYAPIVDRKELHL